MAILKVARLGHPILRTRAKPVLQKDISSGDIQRLIDSMIETMVEYNGVGLAAPQVHASQQIAVLRVRDNPRYPDAPEIPLTILINPRIRPLSRRKEEDWEGCLSIPDLRGCVPRYSHIRVEAFDRKGEKVSFVARGFHARVVQHEYDHLQGKVYLDRMKDFSSLTHLTEYVRYGNHLLKKR